MIENIEITGVGGYAPDEQTRKYIRKRIGRLDRKATRHARKSMRAEVKLSQVDRARGNKYEVEAILVMPERRLVAKDSTMNIMAATDIVEAKLASQLSRYKAARLYHVGRRKILDRFKRSYAREVE